MLGLFTIALGCAFVSPFALRTYIKWQFADHHYSIADVPPRPVAIVFGAQVRPNGRLSAMLADRVKTGVTLYQQGKVERLLMSGDHLTAHYNEPDAMRRYAIELGVPPEDVLLDYGGLRTYDTCYRAQHLYTIDSAILVTQEFHLDRALWVCQTLGIDSVGVAADVMRPQGYGPRTMRWSRWREIVATSAAALDLLRGIEPRLGLNGPPHLEGR